MSSLPGAAFKFESASESCVRFDGSGTKLSALPVSPAIYSDLWISSDLEADGDTSGPLELPSACSGCNEPVCALKLVTTGGLEELRYAAAASSASDCNEAVCFGLRLLCSAMARMIASYYCKGRSAIAWITGILI